MKIHLWCTDCGGDLTYEMTTRVDSHEAHEKPHKKGCEWVKAMVWPEYRGERAMLYLSETGEDLPKGHEKIKHTFPDRKLPLNVLASRDVPVCSEQL